MKVFVILAVAILVADVALLTASVIGGMVLVAVPLGLIDPQTIADTGLIWTIVVFGVRGLISVIDELMSYHTDFRKAWGKVSNGRR